MPAVVQKVTDGRFAKQKMPDEAKGSGSSEEMSSLDDELDNVQEFDENGEPMTVVAFDPTNMQGRTFLTRPNEDKEIRRAQIVKIIVKTMEGNHFIIFTSILMEMIT